MEKGRVAEREDWMKVSFKRIARRLTGTSTPVFGVSWNPPEAEREIVRKLITFLEDHRALYNPLDIGMPQYIDRAIAEVRRQLTSILETLDENSEIAQHVRAMRAACRKFPNETTPHNRLKYYGKGDSESSVALGELRSTFGTHIAQLGVMYGIDVEEELVSTLPALDDE